MIGISWGVAYVLFVACPPIFTLLGLILKSSRFLYVAAALAVPLSAYLMVGFGIRLGPPALALFVSLVLSGYLVRRYYYLSIILALPSLAIFVFIVTRAAIILLR